MRVPVGGDLVAKGRCLTDQLGISLGNPSEEEAGDGGAVLAKDLQKPSEVCFDVARERCPLCNVRRGGEREDVKPVLHVHREDTHLLRVRFASSMLHRIALSGLGWLRRGARVFSSRAFYREETVTASCGRRPGRD